MGKPKRNTTPPHALIERFKKAEVIDQIAVMMVADGFDSETLRVLSAWKRSDHQWLEPKRPCPEPMLEAWKWLVEGWSIDVDTIAETANVSISIARSRVNVLLGNRLIYPDGTMVTFAVAALHAHLKKQLGMKDKKKDKDEDKKIKPAKQDDGDEAN